MNYLFLFFIGSISGWFIELLFRRIVHGKWVNPGFLIGPYLPIYGFGLCAMTLIYNIVKSLSIPYYPDLLAIIFIGIAMTLIELIGGIGFIYGGGVKLWDYSDRWGNYKGIICPLFSLIWTAAGAIFYYLLAPIVINLTNWFSLHQAFLLAIGYFYGIITIDFIYSTKLLMKLRKIAKDNKIKIRYEQLKLDVKKQAEINKEKYSFLFPLRTKDSLIKIKEILEKVGDKFE